MALSPETVLTVPVTETLPRLNSPPPWATPPLPPLPPVATDAQSARAAVTAGPVAADAPGAAVAAERLVGRDRGAVEGHGGAGRIEDPAAFPGAALAPAKAVLSDDRGPEWARAGLVRRDRGRDEDDRPAEAAGAADRLVRRDRGLGEGERPGRVEGPAALAGAAAAGAAKEPAAPAATLFATTTELSVNWPPSLRIPPPSPVTRPCWIVTPVIDTLPPRTSMTRSVRLPSMIVRPAPCPWIVTLALMSSSPAVPLFALLPKRDSV